MMAVHQMTDSVSADLNQLLILTEECQMAIGADNPEQLEQLIEKRQSCMDRIDVLRADGYTLTEEHLQKLSQIAVADQTLQLLAENLSEQYREALKSLRGHHRFIKAYTRDPELSSQYLDIKE